MKTLLVTVFTAVSLMLVAAACTKSSTGNGHLCKCAGGISGAGFQTDMGNLSIQEAETKCYSYNQPNITDGYHDCHLE